MTSGRIYYFENNNSLRRGTNPCGNSLYFKDNFISFYDTLICHLTTPKLNLSNHLYFVFFQLQMLGYDISWAIFNIIEVMSSNKFTFKRIGYLAASQSFHADSELLMLTTNMIRKDLNAQNQYEAGLALSGLSCFISHDLARDLANDIMTLVSHFFPLYRSLHFAKH